MRDRYSPRLLTMFALLPAAFVLMLPGVQAAPPSKELQQQLIHAVLQDQIATVRTLLEKGGDPNARVAFGKEDAWFLNSRPGDDPAPPLIVLACRFRSIEGPGIIEQLLKKGADVNIADKNGVTPLMFASELGGSVSLLLEHGAKVNGKDHTGKTPLMYAMNNRGLGAVADLLKHGAEINARDAQGTTPLMIAIRSAVHDPVRLYGEDLIQKRKIEKESYVELIRFLIERGADVNARDKVGNRPLKLAEAQKQAEVVELLKKAGAKE
jgi:ankyrin repeat protein